ncbi:MAG: class I SAM-dependent methyltransferase [Symploca sp. SIO1B1]|nr:class I SAM-dependent methyltransferase [Symploca sp. SIO1C2]NER93759.1 class I SAM-dependent methyltransferase [Symploca sp. SIO1B1]
MNRVQENKAYKLTDYLARSNDIYTLNKYKIIMNWLPQTEDMQILNAGCGSGEMNIMLAQRHSWQVDAIDIDSEAISLSQKLKSEANLVNLNLFNKPIEEHLPQHQYDIIVSNDVLEHIENDVQVIKKFSEMLKQNGTICISVPAYPWLFGFHDENLGHYRRYTKQDLLSKISRYFKIEKYRYFAASLIPVVLLYSCWLRKPYPVNELNQKSYLKMIFDWLLIRESKITLPLGISLIVLATKS